MQNKWKYKVIRIKTPTFAKAEVKAEVQQDALNRLGMEGWELVDILIGAHETSPQYYLKRPY
ncbi:MAG: hypothetical protein COA69_06550 [Robiginitomaculum sp.]|nr:MAG: hypothetical protein COA69_06550 [Robiginitomaculum sp.]